MTEIRRAALRLSCLLAGLVYLADARIVGAAEGETPATPMAGPPAAPPTCGVQAARYDDGAGFGLLVTRVGRTRIENPLRPLTPEVTQVLLVVIGGKVATAYGRDLGALRRGASPSAVEAVLGGPVRWDTGLPSLPETIAIVGEDGAALARLAFRACEEPPAVSAQQAKPTAKKPGKPRGPAAAKTPPGFSLPQGAIAE